MKKLSQSLNIIDYIFLLKLIRGVLVARKKPDENIINWLKKSFRWRPIGFGKQTQQFLKGTGLRGNLYKKLILPLESNIFIRLIHERLDASLAEGITLSLYYIVPLIVLDNDAASTLARSQLAVLDITSTKKMNTKFIKLHMRIAEYSMKDLYRQMIMDTLEYLPKARDLKDVLDKRRKLILRDSKRFWRINQGKGRAIISYLDPMLALGEKDLAKLQEDIKSNPLSALSLGHIVAIYLPNILEQN